MSRFLRPSEMGEKALRIAVDMVRQGRREDAARMLERVFGDAFHPTDLQCFVHATLTLGLTPWITDGGMLKAIADLQADPDEYSVQPWLRDAYQELSPAKEDSNPPDGHAMIARAFHLATEENETREAEELILKALQFFIDSGDRRGEVDALHFCGCIAHETGDLDNAMGFYDQALNLAEAVDYREGVARAHHERGRIFKSRYDFISSENCFRYALNYYARASDMDNLQMALDGLSALANDALVSPEFFLPALGKGDVPVGTPEEFMYVRAMAILAEIRDQGRYFRQRLLQKAIAVFPRDPAFAEYIRDEALRSAELRSDSLIHRVGGLLGRLWASPPVPAAPRRETRPTLQGQAAKFTTPETPAPDIGVLLDTLNEADAAASYVYRGQTREYPGPLLPSMYRKLLGEGDTCLTPADPLYERSLRKCGQMFYGEYNRKFFGQLQHAFDGVPPDEREALEAVYQRVMRDPWVARHQLEAQANGQPPVSWDESLRAVLPDEEIAIYEQRREQWQPYLDSYHRRTIRMFGFFKPFGYLLGTTLAQQFGLSSAGLDATRSPLIAAFFATHRSEVGFAEVEREGLGVIYRFPYKPTDIREHPLTRYTYYTLPSVIDLQDVLGRFERPGLTRDEVRDLFDCYYGAVYLDGLREIDLFMMPASSLESSRIARQQAVIILPDEIRKDREDVEPGVDGITLPEYQFIEDLAARQGVEKFYFRHTGQASLPVRREQLWPRDDPFLEIVISIMTALYPLTAFQGHIIPHRLDLLDAGYDAAAFLEICKSLARRDPIVLMDYPALHAMSLLTMVL